MKRLKPRRLKINSIRNSTCGSARLADLDWSHWCTDIGFAGCSLYLHVAHVDGETAHRVHCKHALRPRLEMKDGELYWLVDEDCGDYVRLLRAPEYAL